MTAWRGLSGVVHPLRLSRRFGAVDVDISSARLRQIATGGVPGEQERIDLGFALIATNMLADQRRTRRARVRRRLTHWAVVAGGALIALNLLLCPGLLFFAMTQRAHPY